jgi:transmembrane sensor
MMKVETGDTVLQDAQQWFVLLRDDAATAEDRRRFTAWLAADPAHRRAWDDTERLWTRLDAVVPALRLETLDLRGVLAPQPVSMTRRTWLKQAAAAALVLGGGTAWYATSADLFADHRTAVGERRGLTLADGSRVDLDAGSALSVAFTDGQRRITLHHGRAFFQVAKDAARPFVVVAGNGEVRALGTAFDVKHGLHAVRVAVSEHAVAVSVAGESARLEAGAAMDYSAAGLGAAAGADIASLLSWRQDRLFFQEAPLSDVVADLDRYRRGRIVILDEAIANLPVTGFFHAAQAEAALQTIAATLPVRLTRLTDRLVLIRAR